MPPSSKYRLSKKYFQLGLKNNPSPDPAQCGKPTALGTPFKKYFQYGAALYYNNWTCKQIFVEQNNAVKNLHS